MIKLDDNLLQQLGLGALHPEEKKKMLAHIYETLEMRVGMELAKKMTDAQLSEFEQFINRNDEAGALRWLETNFPNYKDVVAAEFEKLKAEIAQAAPQIMAANSGQQPLPPQPQPYPGQQYAQPAPAQYGPAPQQPYPNQPQMPPAGQPAYYPPQPAAPNPGQHGQPYPGQPQQHPQQHPQQPGQGDYDLAA